MKIKCLLLFFFVFILVACGKSNEDYLLESIDDFVRYLNEHDITIYFNTDELEQLKKIDHFNTFEQFNDIVFEESFTFIGYDVEYKRPDSDDIERIKDLLEEETTDYYFNICFFGTKDFDYLEPLISTEKSQNFNNTDTIATCFGNFPSANTQYTVEVMGYTFQDIVKNDLLYQKIILEYIERQVVKYYQSIG